MKKIELPNGGTYKIKNDSYRTARGAAAILEIFCTNCDNLALIYQKDGPGPLLRCYLDRIAWPESYSQLEKKFENLRDINCEHCGAFIATPMIYEKENRLAYRMTASAFRQKIRK